MVAGFDSLAIMRAGGWKTQHVLLLYAEYASTRAMHEGRWKAMADTAARHNRIGLLDLKEL